MSNIQKLTSESLNSPGQEEGKQEAVAGCFSSTNNTRTGALFVVTDWTGVENGFEEVVVVNGAATLCLVRGHARAGKAREGWVCYKNTISYTNSLTDGVQTDLDHLQSLS